MSVKVLQEMYNNISTILYMQHNHQNLKLLKNGHGREEGGRAKNTLQTQDSI